LIAVLAASKPWLSIHCFVAASGQGQRPSTKPKTVRATKTIAGSHANLMTVATTSLSQDRRSLDCNANVIDESARGGGSTPSV
jgi:hypothetical protein